jgi:hypothetical protein
VAARRAGALGRLGGFGGSGVVYLRSAKRNRQNTSRDH